MWRSLRFCAAAAALAIVASLGPALALVLIQSRSTVELPLQPGPRFYEYGSGQAYGVDTQAEWDASIISGLTATGGVATLDGLTGPAWWDPAYDRRSCHTVTNPGPLLTNEVVSFFLDTADFIANEGMDNGAQNLAVIHAGGTPLRYRILGPVPDAATEVLVDIPAVQTGDPDPVCFYWGSPTANSASDPDVARMPTVDRTMLWERWLGTRPGIGVDSVNWNGTPVSETVIGTAETPGTRHCNNCGLEVSGFIVPTVTGNYTFWISTDDAGTLLLSTDDTTANLTEIASVVVWARKNQFQKYAQQRSAPIALVAGQRYAVRSRVREVGGLDHIQIAWTPPGGVRQIVPGANLQSADGTAGGLTFKIFNQLTVPDQGPSQDAIVVTQSGSGRNTCDNCRHGLSGYFVAPEAGDYTFFLSSNNSGFLQIAPGDNPTALVDEATVPTNWTNWNQWTQTASQRTRVFSLSRGEILFMKATAFENRGGDHVQIGWTKPSDPPGTIAMINRDSLSRTPPVPVASLATIAGTLQTVGGVGLFETPAVDLGTAGTLVFGEVTAEAVLPAGSALTFQLATAPTAAGPWNYVGPNNDPALQFSATAELVDFVHDGNQFLRIRGQLTSTDPNVTPEIQQITVEGNLVEIDSAVEASAAIPAVSQRTLRTAARQPWLRVKSVDPLTAATSLVQPPPAGLDIQLTLEPAGTTPHHIYSEAVANAAGGTQRSRWAGTRSDGIVVTHTFDVTVDPVLPALQLVSCDRFAETVVITNTTNADLALAGWRLFDDGTATVDLGTLQATLPANSNVTILTGPAVRPGLRWRFSNVWNNGGDNAHLTSPLGDPEQIVAC